MHPQTQKHRYGKSLKEIIQEKVVERLKMARSMPNQYLAIQEYQKVLFLDQNNVLGHKELASLYVQLGDLSPAIACLQQALHLQQSNDTEEKLQTLIQQRGQSLLEQGDWNNFLEGTEFERFGTFLKYYLRDLERLKANKEIERVVIRFFQRAHCFALTNHLVYALQETENALKLNQALPELFLLRGKLLWALNKEPQGNFDYWKAHSLQPNNAEVLEFLSHVIPKTTQIIADTKFLVVQNATEKCHLNIKRGLELYPNNTDLLLIKSYLHRTSGEYEQALIDLDVCLRSNKDSELEAQINHQIALTYNEMAMFLFQKAKFEDSLTLFNEALKYKPQDWGILVNRGDASKELGKVDEALHDYQAALKLASTRPDIIERVVQLISQKAIESFNKRQYEIALSYFGQALELSPNQAQLLTKRGKCYFEMQRYQDALADYNAALVLDPQNFEARNFLLQMISTGREKKQAIIYLDQDDS